VDLDRAAFVAVDDNDHVVETAVEASDGPRHPERLDVSPGSDSRRQLWPESLARTGLARPAPCFTVRLRPTAGIEAPWLRAVSREGGRARTVS